MADKDALELFDRLRQEVETRAQGRWAEVLEHLGVPYQYLRKHKAIACPICGAQGEKSKRGHYSFRDKDGKGGAWCQACGGLGPWAIAKAFSGGLSHGDQVRKAAEWLNCQPTDAPVRKRSDNSDERKTSRALKEFEEAQPVVRGDAVDIYLRGRGIHLKAYPDTIRCHPALPYFVEVFDKGSTKPRWKKVATWAAMIARIDGPDGKATAVHRTWLLNGKKAPAPNGEAKKTYGPIPGGSYIELFEPQHGRVVTAEGIESTFAAMLMSRRCGRVGINAGNLAQMRFGEEITDLLIWGENDESFTGQHHAYALAYDQRNADRRAGIQRPIEVYIPRRVGIDANDELLEQLEQKGTKVA